MGNPQRSRQARPTARTIALLLSVALVAFAAAACAEDNDAGAPSTPTSTPLATSATSVPGADEAVTLRGTLTLDGAPLEAQFLGVRVIRDGLATACQNTIPDVVQGRYEIIVAADAEVRGCGAPGAELLLWAHADGVFFFSAASTPWPGSGATATFDASFSTEAREGASKPVTEFKGLLFDRDGRRLPGGTVIEAFAGDVRCGVSSLRRSNNLENLYVLVVAGPESVSGCAEDARLTFRLDGQPAAETALNDLANGSEGHELNLTVR